MARREGQPVQHRKSRAAKMGRGRSAGFGCIEALEGRVLCVVVVGPTPPPQPVRGEIRGVAYNDVYWNGMYDLGRGLSGRRIFVDKNRDGKFQRGEPFRLTDNAG